MCFGCGIGPNDQAHHPHGEPPSCRPPHPPPSGLKFAPFNYTYSGCAFTALCELKTGPCHCLMKFLGLLQCIDARGKSSSGGLPGRNGHARSTSYRLAQAT
eukprot:8149-Eustigmatos_ZCMA.PRE.1